MEFSRYGNFMLIRLDRGEEIVEALTQIAVEQDLRLAQISGIGAVDDFTVGLFDPETKQYRSNRFTGPHEIVSLNGNLTQMEGKSYLHLHLSAADGTGKVVGGHLNRAKISATGEIILTLAQGETDRIFSPEIGLNLLKFQVLDAEVL